MSRITAQARRFLATGGVIAACLIVFELRVYHRQPSSSNSEFWNVPGGFREGAKAKHPDHVPTTYNEGEINRSNKLDFAKQRAAIQTTRKRVLRDTCEKRNLVATAGPPRYTQQHMHVIDNYKAIYCFVPKVGCSNWKRVLMVLNGERDSVDGLTSEEVHQQSQLRFFYSYTAAQQDSRLKNYRKFAFVREPLQRVVSVYRNKFENLANYRANEKFHRFGRQIVSKFRRDATEVARQTGENVTWVEFVNYLTHPDERAEMEKDAYFSDHWAAMHRILSPCTVDYDVIGKLKTITDDAKYVLDLLQAPGKVKYLSATNSRPTNSSKLETFFKYYSQLSSRQLTKLWDLYKLDYELFGYSKPSIIP